VGHDLVRVVVELEPSEWHGNATERLWAEPVGDGRYRLRNTPFFAFGVSNGDIVFAEVRDGALSMTGVSIRGGHSTYRLKLSERGRGAPAFKRSWLPLQAIGCTFEEGPVLAVDVPASADIYAVYGLLEAGADSGAWDFEEGHCGHLA